MKIEIKERKLTEGKRALYLEYYETGFRKRESLHLYLLPDDAVGAAKHNRLTYNKAMEIRAERILTPPTLEKENAKSEEQGNGLTWLQWCDDYIKWSVDCGNCKKMIGHKNVVRKRIATYLRRVDKKDILLKDVGKDEICGLFDYVRNKYRNKRQIKTNGGRLADYSLLLFEETVKAIFDELKLPNVLGKVWTTDAIYRETKAKFDARKKEGCIAVEMELAGVQAVCDFYGWELYNFLVTGDVLDQAVYDVSGLADANHNMDKLYVAIEIAKRI